MVSRKTLLVATLVASNAAAFTPNAMPLFMTTSSNRVASSALVSPSQMMVDPAWAGSEEDGRRRERQSLDISRTIYTSSMKSPKDAYVAFAEKGAGNAKMSKHKIFHQSVLGGAYVGFGGLLALCISGNIGGIAAMNPGIPKIVFAALFPVNLLLTVCTGGQLFTGNTATVSAAKMEGLVEWWELGKSLFMSLLGNIVGCFLFAWAANYAGLLSGGTGSLAAKTAVGKCGSAFGPTVVKAILCNWMVTLAVFLSGAANDLTSKMIGIWFPISTFVGIGLEHSVANLFIFPAAIMAGAPLTFWEVVAKNIFPVVLGNLIAGALVVAGSYSYQFGNLGKASREKFQDRQAQYKVRMALKRKTKEAERQAKIQSVVNGDGGTSPKKAGPLKKVLDFVF